MTKIDAAITQVGRVEFTVVSVLPSALSSNTQAEQTIRGLSRYFPGRPIVLAAKTGSRFRFVGRRDLTQFLAKTPISGLPWKTYTFAD
jgi:hypothetical protein